MRTEPSFAARDLTSNVVQAKGPVSGQDMTPGFGFDRRNCVVDRFLYRATRMVACFHRIRPSRTAECFEHICDRSAMIEAQEALAPKLREPVFLEDCGHWAPQERSAQISETLVRFLAEVGLQEQ